MLLYATVCANFARDVIGNDRGVMQCKHHIAVKECLLTHSLLIRVVLVGQCASRNGRMKGHADLILAREESSVTVSIICSSYPPRFEPLERFRQSSKTDTADLSFFDLATRPVCLKCTKSDRSCMGYAVFELALRQVHQDYDEDEVSTVYRVKSVKKKPLDIVRPDEIQREAPGLPSSIQRLSTLSGESRLAFDYFLHVGQHAQAHASILLNAAYVAMQYGFRKGFAGDPMWLSILTLQGSAWYVTEGYKGF